MNVNVYSPQSPSIQLLGGDLPNVFSGSVILLSAVTEQSWFLCLTRSMKQKHSLW